MMNKILIYNSGGGLGDSIQLFPLLISLKVILGKQNFIIWELIQITLMDD